MEIIVLDIETTGFYPKKGDVMVELGMALVDTDAKTIFIQTRGTLKHIEHTTMLIMKGKYY